MATITDEKSVLNTSLVWNLLANTTTTQQLVGNRGYIGDSTSQVVFTLPTTINVGEIIAVLNRSTGGWKIAQNASQSIRVVSVTTTTGAGGYLESTNQGDSIYLVCTTQDTGFKAFFVMGNITYV